MSDNENFPLALPTGTVLAGQYTIDRVLGQGGFGITYAAVDHSRNLKVAVKEFFPDTLAFRENATTVKSYPGERSENFEYGKEGFLQEAKTLAEFIGCNNVVRIYSYFEENGTAYFVMEYIEGTSFDNYIEQHGGKVTMEDAKRILIPVMDALAVVHSKGIVHRDVTPDNIYITNSGEVKLLDFGAARYSLGDKSRSLDVILKHGFAPKEQYTRRGKQGPFTDVYSLGATFYFALTGRRPPDSIDRIEEDELVPPSTLGVQITEYEERAILQAMDIQPAGRFQTMTAFKDVFMNETVMSGAAPPAQPVQQMFFAAPPQVQPPAQTVGQTAMQPPAMPAQQPTKLEAQPKKGNGKLIAILSSIGAVLVAGVIIIVVSVNKKPASPVYYVPGESGSSFTSTYSSKKPDISMPIISSKPSSSSTPNTTQYTDVTPVGNHYGNIAAGGVVSYGKNGHPAYIDNNMKTLEFDGNTVYTSTTDLSCVSYDSDSALLYFLDSQHVCVYSFDAPNDPPLAYTELDKYLSDVNRLYVTEDYFFIYSRKSNASNGKLHRISLYDFTNVQSVDVGIEGSFTILGDRLYKIENNSDGKSGIQMYSALDFSKIARNKDGESRISIDKGNILTKVTTDGTNIFTVVASLDDLWIYQFNNDLDLDSAVWWKIGDSISSAVGDEYANIDLPVVAGNMITYTLIDSGFYPSPILCTTPLLNDGEVGKTQQINVSPDKVYLKSANVVSGKAEIIYIGQDGACTYRLYDSNGNNVTNQ